MGYTRDVYTGTGKAVPAQTTKAHEGAHIQFHLFLTPALDGSWWSLEPQPLNSQGEPCVTTGWYPDNLGTLEKEKISCSHWEVNHDSLGIEFIA